LNLSQFVGFQDSPNLSKIEKVAETCEFDGKEPLLVERTIAISTRVFGMKARVVKVPQILRYIKTYGSGN